jgi:hypothetical protein
MGKCILNFDQIEILNQKSDSSHSDNDWMIVVWMIGGEVARKDKIALRNTAGSTALHSGDEIQPFSVDIDCADSDVVSAIYDLVNLGSLDPADQIETAGKIAEDIAKMAATVYLKIAEEFIRYNPEIPLASVWADGIQTIAPVIVQSVGAAFEDIIIPGVETAIDLARRLLGVPNCNGDVLHDVAVFPAFQPLQEISNARVYTASSRSGCGAQAKTSVHWSLQRAIEGPFHPGPLPRTELVPSRGESADNFLGAWAEDSFTTTPIITVHISRSTAASGSYSVKIHENVDRRFDAVFDAAKDVLLPHPKLVQQYDVNVFGTIRAWVAHPYRPGGLRVHQLEPAPAGGQDAGAEGAARRLVFRLPWQRAARGGSPLQVRGGELRLDPVIHEREIGGPTPAGVPAFSDACDVIELAEQGVRLCLYKIEQDQSVIGHAIRYIRKENLSYTRADVLLVQWHPAR